MGKARKTMFKLSFMDEEYLGYGSDANDAILSFCLEYGCGVLEWHVLEESADPAINLISPPGGRIKGTMIFNEQTSVFHLSAVPINF